MTTNRSILPLAIVTAAAALAGPAGCNYISAAYVLAHGPATTPALHTLDKDRPTIVVVDDRGNRLPSRGLRVTVAKSAQTVLLESKTLKNVIDSGAAAGALTQERTGELMDLTSIAKSVKAEVMIYARVDDAALSQDGQTLNPKATLRVKVLDVNKKPPRVWPAESEGYTLVVTPMLRANTGAPATGAEMAAAYETFAREIGVELAELFFEHETKHPVNPDAKK